MMQRRRRGFTLPELLIALVCGAVLFAAIASASLRQQRLFAELADNVAVTGRLREATATLPIDLRAVSPAAGDLRDARDTSLEIRATIASAVVCDTVGRSIVLAPALTGAETYASFVTSVATGDTAWLLDVRDTIENWMPGRITSVSSATANKCAAGGPLLNGPFLSTTFVFDSLPVGCVVGSVLRVTRPIRYSLYRSADGSWQLGARDWNSTSVRLNTIQPVAGPLLAPSERGLVFTYVDTSGGILVNPAASPAGLALIRVAARAQAIRPVRVLGASRTVRRVDSLDAAIFLHNRR
jgi:prepilin-type N-terminal cleavage/methylation domain-containing protein